MTKAIEVVLVSHSVHEDISEDEMRASVPSDWLVRRAVDIRPVRLTFAETFGADWVAHAREQARQWDAEVRPLLEQYPVAQIAYFGLAPIPLAVHLGSLTQRWRHVNVFLRHHTERRWTYSNLPCPNVTCSPGPAESVRSTQPVIISVSTTLPADIDSARAVVGATSAEIEIRTADFGEDVLASEEAVHAVAEQFRIGLERVETYRVAASEVHLVAAVPVGLAFLLGTFITATRHARLITYQYHRSYEPRLAEALRLPLRAATAYTLTTEASTAAANLRSAWEADRKLLVEQFAKPAAHWSAILGDLGAPFRGTGFEALQQVAHTPLLSPIDLNSSQAADGFRYDLVANAWHLSDGLLESIQQFVPRESLGRAGRMLLLHEALHHGQQGLNSASAPRIRLAPKVLEELDYMADIWAMLHDFAFEGLVVEPWSKQRAGLLAILETAIRTMWAFDTGQEPGLLEVRRVNRYLIWYVNLARVERAGSAADAMQVLANKPIIDLVGPPVAIREGRLMVLLDRPATYAPELCLINRRGSLRRLGTTNAASIAEVALALGAHDHEKLRREIGAFVDGEFA